MFINEDSSEINVIAQQHREEANYWLNQLSGELEKIHFPYDFTKTSPGVETSNNEQFTDEIKFQFTRNLSQNVLKLSNHSDYRLYMILLAGLILLLNKYTSKNDIIIGSPIFKQEVKKKFINTILILKNQVDSNFTFKELLLRVKQTVTEAVR